MRNGLIILLSAVLLLLVPYPAFAYTIIIDAGHGGYDPGAIGVNGLREKEVNLDIAQKLKNELLERGHQVIMSRESDTYLSLQERVELARRSDGQLFVSIHANAHTQSSANGSLVLYYDNRYPQYGYPASSEMRMLSNDSYDLAVKVLESLVGEIHTENRGVVPSSVYVVRNGRVPSILVETAFLSNASDASLLASDEVRARIAKGIADGIVQYEIPVFFDMGRHWAKEPVLHLEKLGVVHGNNRMFEPDRSMTRAEFVTMLDRIFIFDQLLEQADSNTLDPIFPDLNLSHWAGASVIKAAMLGILMGYEDGTIRPDQPLNRAQMAVIFDRIAMSGIAATDIDLPFIDTVKQSWYESSITKIYLQGWMTGMSTTVFAPNHAMTRAEAASVLDRYLNSQEGSLVRAQLEQHLPAM